MFSDKLSKLKKENNRVSEMISFARGITELKSRSYQEFITNNTKALSVFQPMISEWHERDTNPKYFNLFNVLDVRRREYIHSNVLTWLLNPKGNHGLGTRFVNEILKHAGLPEITDIRKCDVKKEISGEESIIDITVSTESLLLFIENKIESEEGYEQTGREYRDLKARAGNRIYKGIFLTLHGDNPTEKEFIPWSYFKIISIIENIIEERNGTNDNNIKRINCFLTDYIGTLQQMI
jgi:hypothetical protein